MRFQLEADQLYKSHFGKMVSSLLHFSDAIDLETAEDLVQDSFSAAMISWRKRWLARQSRGLAFSGLQKQGTQ